MVPRFRCWDERLGLTEVVSIDFFRKKIKINHWEYGDSNFFPLDEVVLMQSTGLKDKNGVEIFEGDIVAYDDYEFSYTAIVKKETYYFWLKGIEPDDAFHLEDISDEYDDTTDLTVIGNIYDNPNLLEQANEN